jgi:hypothetical protein
MKLALKGGFMSHGYMMHRLHAEANGIRGLYGVPVYLCGSALMDTNEKPRDWDFRITLADADFEMRYGVVDEWVKQGQSGYWTDVRWRWSDDCVKRSKAASAHLGLNVDFQAYPASYAKRFKGQPRLRLDTRRGKVAR